MQIKWRSCYWRQARCVYYSLSVLCSSLSKIDDEAMSSSHILKDKTHHRRPRTCLFQALTRVLSQPLSSSNPPRVISPFSYIPIQPVLTASNDLTPWKLKMADLRDEYGNPIQLTDEFGNPVQLRDEHGNPMHLTGVATAPHAGHGGGVADTDVAGGGAGHHAPKEELRRSGSSSSSSSSEDDGQGGRRKKGLKQKIKEKLGGGKQEDRPTATGADKHGAAAATTTPGGLQGEHEKKSMMEKIKEKLPGHHAQ